MLGRSLQITQMFGFHFDIIPHVNRVLMVFNIQILGAENILDLFQAGIRQKWFQNMCRIGQNKSKKTQSIHMVHSSLFYCGV